MNDSFCVFESVDDVEILIADYRGCDVFEFLRRLRIVRDQIVLRPPASALVLTLAAGVGYSPEGMRELVTILRETKPHVAASAVVGLGHLTLLVNVINRLSGREVQAFENIDEARRWLRKSATRAAGD